MKKDRKRDHIMSKEERDQLWRELGERNERGRVLARGNAPPPRDYEIIDRDGKPMLVCPWHQELPAGGADLYFWNILEELRSNLEESTQDEFLEALNTKDEGSRALLRAFCSFALDAAKATAQQRYKEWMEGVEEVRMSVGFYEDKEST